MRLIFSALLVTTMSVLSAGPVIAGEDIEPAAVYTERLAPLPFAGAYIGATVGWVHADADQTLTSTAPGQPPVTFRTSSDDDGWALGGHVGYNWQRGRLVYGIEADFSWMDVDPSFTETVVVPFGQDNVRVSQTLTASYNYFGTVRGRLGWAHENLLIYGTGGFAYAGLDHKFINPATVFGNIGSFSDHDLKAGWTAGGGIELARGHWSLRAEALYVDLHDTTRTYIRADNPDARIRVRWEDDFVVARVGFSVKLHHDEPRYEPLK